MGRAQRQIGKLAELWSAGWLILKGYVILERNYRSRWGEIDIIAKDHDEICFIEVKKRRSNAFGTPLEQVVLSKQQKIIKTALRYIQTHYPIFPACRFDVISIGRFNKVEHLKNIFQINTG